MNDETSTIEKIIAKLTTERDELRVRMHLAKEDLQDEWEGLEQKWEKMEQKLAAAKDETRESSSEVGAAATLLAEEIRGAYQRIRKTL